MVVLSALEYGNVAEPAAVRIGIRIGIDTGLGLRAEEGFHAPRRDDTRPSRSAAEATTAAEPAQIHCAASGEHQLSAGLHPDSLAVGIAADTHTRRFPSTDAR
jgi:hypothetical protein